MEEEKSYTQIETLPPHNFIPVYLRSMKIPIKRGSRYFDVSGIMNVVIYSKPDVIKLMPLKENAMIDVWDVDEFKNQVMLLKFTNVPHPPINRANVSEHLLEYQFNIIGKTMANTITEAEWKKEWKLTKKQKEMFKSYAVGILKKVFRFNGAKARETYEFFDKNFGLLTL
jgi:hypothetical protein